MAALTGGRTGHDIETIIQRAAKMPRRKIDKGTHFTTKSIPFQCLSPTCNLEHVCHDSAEGAFPQTYDDANFEKTCIPSITYNDLYEKVMSSPATVSEDDLLRYEEYCKKISLKY